MWYILYDEDKDVCHATDRVFRFSGLRGDQRDFVLSEDFAKTVSVVALSKRNAVESLSPSPGASSGVSGGGGARKNVKKLRKCSLPRCWVLRSTKPLRAMLFPIRIAQLLEVCGNPEY